MSEPQTLPPKEDNELIYLPKEIDQNDEPRVSDKSEISDILHRSISDLIKYSDTVRETFIHESIISSFTTQLELFQRSCNIQLENIKVFFRILQNEKISISNEQYCDLYRLSEHFQVYPLTRLLKIYFQRHIKSVDFILNILKDQIMIENCHINTQFEMSKDMEEILTSNIEECLLNPKFGQLPISTIYRIIEKSDIYQKTSDLLYDFIKQNIKERFTLFRFLNFRKLTDEKFNSLYELFESDDDNEKKKFIDYFHFDLDYIKYLKDENKRKEKQIFEGTTKIEELQNQLKEVEQERDKLKAQDKIFSDRICSIIRFNQDEDIIHRIERDFQFSENIRNHFTNSTDEEILFYICKDTKLSSCIRNFFKSSDDSWIKNQIEEDHKRIPELENQLNNLENEKNAILKRSVEIETNLQNQVNKERNQNEELKTKNNELNSRITKETQDNFELVKIFISEISDINKILTSGIFH